MIFKVYNYGIDLNYLFIIIQYCLLQFVHITTRLFQIYAVHPGLNVLEMFKSFVWNNINYDYTYFHQSSTYIFSGVEVKLIILDKIDIMYICTYDDDLKFNRDGINVTTSE